MARTYVEVSLYHIYQLFKTSFLIQLCTSLNMPSTIHQASDLASKSSCHRPRGTANTTSNIKDSPTIFQPDELTNLNLVLYQAFLDRSPR